MDKSRFEIEVLPLYKRMYGLCMAVLRDRDAAADAVQETFVKLWERRDALDGLSSVEAYAMSVVKHTCINYIRESARTANGCRPTTEPTAATDDIDNRGELGLLRRLMDNLPDSQRMVLTLSSFGECSTDEICEITGESSANVRQLLSRARKNLKIMYQKYIGS